MHRRDWLKGFFALASIGAAAGAWQHRRSWVDVVVNEKKYIVRDASLYPQSLRKVAQQRTSLRRMKAGKDNSAAGAAFTRIMREDILPYWYGTPWAFDGNSEMPQQGYIACGYFVTTTLRDAGVPINRIKWAQAASEPMIRHLVGAPSISHHSNRSLTQFYNELVARGQGLYIVGLDTHTGFIVLDGTGAWFIHSSGAYPYRVVQEPLLDSSVLARSAYRVVGRLNTDEAFMQRWLA